MPELPVQLPRCARSTMTTRVMPPGISTRNIVVTVEHSKIRAYRYAGVIKNARAVQLNEIQPIRLRQAYTYVAPVARYTFRPGVVDVDIRIFQFDPNVQRNALDMPEHAKIGNSEVTTAHPNANSCTRHGKIDTHSDTGVPP